MLRSSRKYPLPFPLTASLLAVLLMPAVAQDASGQAAAPPAAAAAPEQALLKAEELDQLVAPIALYPDNLLSLVLMASTYPLEVVQADRCE